MLIVEKITFQLGSTFTYWILSGFRLVNLWCLWRSLLWELTGFAKDSIFLFCVGLFLFLFCVVEFGMSAFLVWRLCWLMYFTFINQDRTWEWFFYFWLKSYEGCELERISFFVYNKWSVIYMFPCNVLCVLKQGQAMFYAFFVGNFTPLVHLHCFKEKWKNWNWENHGHSVFLNLILNWVLHFLKKSGWTMWSSIPMLLRAINMNILCHLTYLAAISSPSLVVWSFLPC